MNVEKEIFDYLDECFNKCVSFKHDDYDYYINYMYSENLFRLKKMNELYGKKSEYFTDDSCVCLFQQDLKNQYFYIDYTIIWSFFSSKYQLNYQQIQQITTSWVNQHDKMKEYTTRKLFKFYFLKVNQHDKMKEYTTNVCYNNISSPLNQHDKMKEYTTGLIFENLSK